MPGSRGGYKNIFYVPGLGFGDEGKGSIVDFLTYRHDVSLIIRFNGGPQAAHHVVTPQGKFHCFSQFGSGSFHPDVKTYLSKYMLIDPLSLAPEAEALRKVGIKNSFNRLFIHENCVVITPFHSAVNKIRELNRQEKKHGSCGKGVSEAFFDSKNKNIPTIKVKDFFDFSRLKSNMKLLGLMKIDLAEQFYQVNLNKAVLRELNKLKKNFLPGAIAGRYQGFVKKVHVISDPEEKKMLREERDIIFEGAQGVLLDQEFGFFPYVTPSNTTLENAYQIEGGIKRNRRRIGVIRLYSVRHGPGPFVTEDEKLKNVLTEAHLRFNPWQGEVRCGWLDLVATRYALKISGVDEIAVTNIDQLMKVTKIKICQKYRIKNDWAKVKKFFKIRRDEIGSVENFQVLENISLEHRRELTRLLDNCEPIYEEFPIWEKRSKNEDLLKDDKFKKIMDFLQSEKGLNCRISILSFGPTYRDKIEL